MVAGFVPHRDDASEPGAIGHLDRTCAGKYHRITLEILTVRSTKKGERSFSIAEEKGYLVESQQREDLRIGAVFCLELAKASHPPADGIFFLSDAYKYHRRQRPGCHQDNGDRTPLSRFFQFSYRY